MRFNRLILPVALLSGVVLGMGLGLGACAAMPVGNRAVPAPARPVNLDLYVGKWFEIGRYDNRFETGCEGVTAEYAVRPDGTISVVNTCHKGAVDGPLKVARGTAKVVKDSDNARLKVSFFGPFYADYWVLDHADDYSWAIVGEPSGRYLWLLSRDAVPSDEKRQAIEDRARALGYDLSRLHRPMQAA